jgi:hypothetical protein
LQSQLRPRLPLAWALQQHLLKPDIVMPISAFTLAHHMSAFTSAVATIVLAIATSVKSGLIMAGSASEPVTATVTGTIDIAYETEGRT